ncbi:MAG: hypothetical protein ACJ76T_05335, partial [Solirubrobacteraceae bacterium]
STRSHPGVVRTAAGTNASEAAWAMAYAGIGSVAMAVLEESSEEPRDPVAAWADAHEMLTNA